LPDELLELTGEISPRPLNRVISALAELFRRFIAFGFAVAINRLLLVAHAEERRLEHVQMAVVHQLIEKLKK
jgi:hypothetical protein